MERVYELDFERANQAFASHILAVKDLHEAQMQLMATNKTVRSLACRFEDAKRELRAATAAAAAATASIDRKRKAAADAEDDFNSHIRLTRHCYAASAGAAVAAAAATAAADPRPSAAAAAAAAEPVYYAVSPVYSAAYSADHASTVNCGGDTPTYNPTSDAYSPQSPSGSGLTPPHRSPIDYDKINGEPIYSPSPNYCYKNGCGSPRAPPHYSPTSPSYSATSPTYCPTTPPYTPCGNSRPRSPHASAAEKRKALKWGC